ncbi:MAG: glycosyltransferase family 2 protein [Candidatus Competibacteraceae bacterium]
MDTKTEKQQKIVISLISPFYNEQESIKQFFSEVIPTLESTNEKFEIICVNDGSEDNTLNTLLEFQEQDKRIRIIDLSRNFGKEAALSAAIDIAQGDAVIPIDADLQDPPDIIPQLIQKWHQGYEVVLAKRSDRSSDSWLKRSTATFFYRFYKNIAETSIPENVGDFRLMSRQAVDAIKQLPEKRRFMKGLFAWVGFKTTTVEYVRKPRISGKSKFNGWQLWNFALEGITSFSTAPLRIWTYLGFLISIFSFMYGIFIITRTLFSGIDVPGYASLLTVVLFIGGIQLVGLGIIGEYIGRIYYETKCRPVYIVRKIYQNEEY